MPPPKLVSEDDVQYDHRKNKLAPTFEKKSSAHLFAIWLTGIKYFKPLLGKVDVAGITFEFHPLDRADGYKNTVTAIVKKAKSFGVTACLNYLIHIPSQHKF